jgi:hypothetical protein
LVSGFATTCDKIEIGKAFNFAVVVFEWYFSNYVIHSMHLSLSYCCLIHDSEIKDFL